MKIINLIKSIPLLLTLIIIIIINIENQKEYTKLKVLVWNTPSLSLGRYIAISTGTGFVLSFILTRNLAKINQKKIEKKIKYKSENKNEQNNLYPDNNNETSYDKTLIERDFNDPSPTINASFRVIGRNNRKNQSIQNNYRNDNNNSYFSDEYDNQNFNQEPNYKKTDEINTILNDWEDDNYLNW